MALASAAVVVAVLVAVVVVVVVLVADVVVVDLLVVLVPHKKLFHQVASCWFVSCRHGLSWNG